MDYLAGNVQLVIAIFEVYFMRKKFNIIKSHVNNMKISLKMI